MAKFYCTLCLAFLCNNVAAASTINLEVEDSSGIFSFNLNADDGWVPAGNLNGSEGTSSLVLSPSDGGTGSVDFEFTLGTQNALFTYIHSDRVMQIAELIVVSGEFSDGIYEVNSFQYSWSSCETIQGSDGCDDFIAVSSLSATLTQTGEVFSLTTSTYVFLVGYSFADPFALDRQFELTPVPVPAALWFLTSALATLRLLGVRSVKNR